MTKMTFIIKSGLKGDFLNGIRRFLKQKLCNGQSLFEDQFGKGDPKQTGYHTFCLPDTEIKRVCKIFDPRVGIVIVIDEIFNVYGPQAV